MSRSLPNNEQLLALARAYGKATGLTLSTIGRRACGNNNQAFTRLAKGQGVNSSTVARATEWFLANWPVNAKWPKGIMDSLAVHQGERMPKLLHDEESNLLEVNDQPGIRLRFDRFIDYQRAIKILQILDEAESSVNAAAKGERMTP